MKRHWPAIAAGVIFLILLGVVVYIYKFKPAEPKKPQTIFQADAAKIASISLASKGSSTELKKVNNNYVMYIPEEVPTVHNKVQGIFQAASKLDYQNIIAQNEKNFGQYGFDNPEAVVKINLVDGSSRTFQVGALAPSGDGYYLREGGQNTVYKVSSETAAQFTQGMNDIADKEIFSGFDKNTADKIIVNFDAQTKTFEKKNGSWWVDGVQMKQDKTNQLMDQFKSISVDGVSPKDKYINTSSPQILRVVVYENDMEYLNTVLCKRDDNSYTVIKEGMAAVQYFVTADNYQKTRDNLVRVFQDAVTP